MLLNALLPLLALSLLAPRAAHADQIQLLDRGDQSLSAFYTAIQGAHKTIDMATFLFEPCDSAPKLLLNALVRKARSGVKVRLVIDAYSLKANVKHALPAYLAGVPNFELRYFNDALTFLTMNGRSHAKVFVVDGHTANRLQIVGGRNMTDEYFGLSPSMNYVDHDLLIRGASAAQAQAEYEELWAASGRARPTGDAREFAAMCLRPTARDAAVAKAVARESEQILAARPVRRCENVTYTLDRPGFSDCQTCAKPGTDRDFMYGETLANKRTTGLFLSFLRGTRAKLEIANQYYMPWLQMDDELARLRQERKTVDVYANATGDIEAPTRNAAFTCYIQSAAARTSVGTQRVSLLSSKGSLGSPWGQSVRGAPWRIHAKSAIRDGQDVLVSSFNIDPRSYHTNLESAVVVEDCPGLAADLSASYEPLRETARADKTCAACKADLVPSNRTPGIFCGGTPDLY
jgi:putative cardiolipin synthase